MKNAEDNRECLLALAEKEERWTPAGPVAGNSIMSNPQNTSVISQNVPLIPVIVDVGSKGLGLHWVTVTLVSEL